MKIPDKVWISRDEIVSWQEEARRLRMKYGIYVTAQQDYEQVTATATKRRPIRIYFMVDEHEFESLNDLEKALQNKAFL